MTTKGKVSQDETFLTSAWEYLRDTETTYGVSVDMELVPQQRKGLWLIYLIANDMLPGVGFNRPVARYRLEFPNSGNQTFCGALFSATNQLDKLVHDFRKQAGALPSSLM